MYKLHIIPVLKDNYVWLLENNAKQVIIIDPGAAELVYNYLHLHNLTPLAILLTHHHIDHIGGVVKLQNDFNSIEVYGPKEIPLPIQYVENRDKLIIADFKFEIIPVPGHTLGHLAYYCQPYLFCGDTLLSAGCGRVFEGTYQQMLNSLNKLAQLPDDTLVCAGHEYTKSNLDFALNMLPNDTKISAYYDLISDKSITLPSTLRNEKQINVFLRCKEKNIQNKLNFNNELDLFVFFRSQKDIF